MPKQFQPFGGVRSVEVLLRKSKEEDDEDHEQKRDCVWEDDDKICLD